MAIAYKLFKIKGGKLFPLYIDTTREIPLNQHLIATAAPKTKSGKVKSKLGELAFRPGWHLTEIPLADHIGKRQPDGKLWQASDTVWCVVEYDSEVDYTKLARSKSTIRRNQCLDRVPVNGFYWYTTNASAKVRWLISGGITVLQILSDQEVAQLCRAAGYEPQPVERKE